jgi:hypothetical protein
MWGFARSPALDGGRIGWVRPGLGASHVCEGSETADVVNMLVCQENVTHLLRRVTQRLYSCKHSFRQPGQTCVNKGQPSGFDDDIDVAIRSIKLIDIRKDTHADLRLKARGEVAVPRAYRKS